MKDEIRMMVVDLQRVFHAEEIEITDDEIQAALTAAVSPSPAIAVLLVRLLLLERVVIRNRDLSTLDL